MFVAHYLHLAHCWTHHRITEAFDPVRELPLLGGLVRSIEWLHPSPDFSRPPEMTAFNVTRLALQVLFEGAVLAVGTLVSLMPPGPYGLDDWDEMDADDFGSNAVADAINGAVSGIWSRLFGAPPELTEAS